MHYTCHANCALLAVLSGFITDAKSRKKSPIWEHFVVGEDTKFALCRICKQFVLHGGCNTKTYNTTNLVHHLKAKHSEQYVLRQILLLEASERVQIWDITILMHNRFISE